VFKRGKKRKAHRAADADGVRELEKAVKDPRSRRGRSRLRGPPPTAARVAAANLGSLAVSPSSKRTFSSISIAPGASRSVSSRTRAPSTAGASGTGSPVNCAKRSATGRIDRAGSTLRAAQVRDEHEPPASAAELPDRQQRRPDAGVVGHAYGWAV
jgi:hypothetical protein